MSNLLLYRSPTKLREGNVFAGICNSVQGNGWVGTPGPRSLLRAGMSGGGGGGKYTRGESRYIGG